MISQPTFKINSTFGWITSVSSNSPSNRLSISEAKEGVQPGDLGLGPKHCQMVWKAANQLSKLIHFCILPPVLWMFIWWSLKDAFSIFLEQLHMWDGISLPIWGWNPTAPMSSKRPKWFGPTFTANYKPEAGMWLRACWQGKISYVSLFRTGCG